MANRNNMRLLAAMVLLVSGFFREAHAFHEGGVANCNGCHTMHNSEKGALVDPDRPGGNSWLMNDNAPSDICLNCHATELGSELSGSPLSPAPTKGGGNFIFLKEDNLNDGVSGAISPIPGDAAGHNLKAPAHGLAAETTRNRSPGGSYPTSAMSCTSCHDPHGNANFRMLYGVGHVSSGNYTFIYPAPIAIAIPVTGSGSETNGNHNAYRQGMSAWCANCHGDFHNNSSNGNEPIFKHKAGEKFGGERASFYARYSGTDNPTSGSFATSYLAQVPFEDAYIGVTSTEGPTDNSLVMCLSCHRAHASSGPHSGRWDFNVTFLAQDGIQSGSYPLPNPYPGPNQRRLCEKCHGLAVP